MNSLRNQITKTTQFHITTGLVVSAVFSPLKEDSISKPKELIKLLDLLFNLICFSYCKSMVIDGITQAVIS